MHEDLMPRLDGRQRWDGVRLCKQAVNSRVVWRVRAVLWRGGRGIWSADAGKARGKRRENAGKARGKPSKKRESARMAAKSMLLFIALGV